MIKLDLELHLGLLLPLCFFTCQKAGKRSYKLHVSGHVTKIKAVHYQSRDISRDHVTVSQKPDKRFIMIAEIENFNIEAVTVTK